MSNVTRNRSKSNPELLVLGRCQRLLEGLSASQAFRVSRWLFETAADARVKHDELLPARQDQETLPFG